jgi:hypothetical protein
MAHMVPCSCVDCQYKADKRAIFEEGLSLTVSRWRFDQGGYRANAHISIHLHPTFEAIAA